MKFIKKFKPISLLGFLNLLLAIVILMCINNQVPVLFDLSMNDKMYGDKFVIMILPLISFFLSIFHLFYEKEEKINKTFNNRILPILICILIIIGSLYSLKAFNYSSQYSYYNNINIYTVICIIVGTLLSIISYNFGILEKIFKTKKIDFLRKIIYIIGIILMYFSIIGFLLDNLIIYILGIVLVIILIILTVLKLINKK